VPQRFPTELSLRGVMFVERMMYVHQSTMKYNDFNEKKLTLVYIRVSCAKGPEETMEICPMDFQNDENIYLYCKRF
jgi:hypothetical protein